MRVALVTLVLLGALAAPAHAAEDAKAALLRAFGTQYQREGIACQLGALVFVVGSYVVARELQSPQRRSHRLAAARQ